MKIKHILVLLSIFASPCQAKKDLSNSITLNGSSLPHAGRVEIKDGGNWTSICDVGWEMKNAQVVCRQMNYSGAEAAILGYAFGPAPGALRTKGFICFGNESSLIECQSTGHTDKRCNKSTVASVLCTPPKESQPTAVEFLCKRKAYIHEILIMVSALVCLAITSVIILIVTCLTMRMRFINKPERNSNILPDGNEIGVSNIGIEDMFEASPAENGEGELETLAGVFGEPELIESCNEEAPPVNVKEERVSNRKKSTKKRYMHLNSSKGLAHCYTKLLEKNRNRRLKKSVVIDRADDYYSDYKGKDPEVKDGHNDISDVDISSTGEYNEIDSESVTKENVKKDGWNYVPTLSLSQSFEKQLGMQVENRPQEEYVDILPPTDLDVVINKQETVKTESDYLDPLEPNQLLPSYPETPDDIGCCGYDEELPEPPKEMLLNDCDIDNGKEGNMDSVSLEIRECGCKNKNCDDDRCLESHFVTKHEKFDEEIEHMEHGNNVNENQSDDDFECLKVGQFNSTDPSNDIKANIQRNSAGYTLPFKIHKMNNKDSISKETGQILSKKNNVVPSPTLSRCIDKRLKPNDTDVYESMTEYRGEESALGVGNIRAKSSAPATSQHGRIFKDDKHLSHKMNEKSCSLSMSSNSVVDKDINRSGFDGDKQRSESFPAELNTYGVSQDHFLKSLEKVLKTGNRSRNASDPNMEFLTDRIRQQKENEKELEHNYELDYEDIPQPSPDSDYENNDIYSNDSSGFRGSRHSSDEYEYDYVHEKQRKSLHFYEALSKESEEDDQYENI